MINVMLYPREQSILLGHEKALCYLKSYISNKWNGNYSLNNYIISGQKGIGKETFIYFFLKEILFKKEDELINLNIRHQIEMGIYPNIINLDGKLNKNTIGIEEIRTTIEMLNKHNINSDPRVIIINKAEDMTRNASNSLLKILEDPQLNVFFFLITQNSSKILDTLRSRCIELKLFPQENLDLTILPKEVKRLLKLSKNLGFIKISLMYNVFDLYDKMCEITYECIILKKFFIIDKFIGSFLRNRSTFVFSISLLKILLYRIVIFLLKQESYEFFSEQEERLFNNIKKSFSIHHWIEVERSNRFFLENLSQNSHLDQENILLFCFLLMENPSIVNE